MAEMPVAFELRFIEELVCRGLVWERKVRSCILGDVRRFLSVNACLDIQQSPWPGGFNLIDIFVMDFSHGAIAITTFRASLHLHTVAKNDRYAQIDLDLSQRVA